MRHHSYQPKTKFVIEPEKFNKYTNHSLLRYCLGATMYMPGTKDFLQPILTQKYPGLTSMVMCFELLSISYSNYYQWNVIIIYGAASYFFV